MTMDRTYAETYFDCNGGCLNDTDEDDICDEFEFVDVPMISLVIMILMLLMTMDRVLMQKYIMIVMEIV